ncbi:ALF repeat-containing protein [Streptomyces anulatus]|nr:hypothetical protein [Streptomyces anulatus]
MKAATTAADAVQEATDVEAAAREAEATRIEQDTEVGIIAARLKAIQEQEALKRIETQRTQSDQTAQEIRDLIARAQEAFTAGDETRAVSSGREAAVKLLDSHGTWTRQAAEFALAAGDYEILNWIDVDRPAAQRQDDRETVLALAEMAAPDVAAGAHVALKSQDPDAASQFLEQGVTDTSVEENRVKVFTILGQQPGPAVKAKAEAALADGSPTALFNFLSTEYVEAVKEDDTVEVFKILNTGGAYLRSAAKVVLEGSALMRRSFIANDQFNVARLDHDAEAHVAAIRAAIAHAAQIAQRALEDAARAAKAAADARKAAAEAADWAKKADDYATAAGAAATKARENAEAADASAAKAAASAKRAESAAVVARSAARAANYSMNQAYASAGRAQASAASAAQSAASARASAEQAGKDAAEAAAVASDAHRIAREKRQQEIAAAAAEAERKAKENAQSGANPADDPGNDKNKAQEDGEFLGLTKDQWITYSGRVSTIAGTISAVAGGAALAVGWIPVVGQGAAAILGGVSLIAGGVSLLAGGVNVIASWGTDDFKKNLGTFALSALFFGKGRAVAAVSKKVGSSLSGIADEVGMKVSGFLEDTTTAAIGWLNWS